MRRFKLILFIVGVAVLCGLVIMLSYDKSVKEETPPITADIEDFNREVPVYVKVVKPREFTRTSDHIGMLEGWNRGMVYSEVNGKVNGWLANIGDILTKDDVMLEIDDEIAQLQFKQANSAMQSAELAYHKAQMDFERAERLFKDNSISKSDYEIAEIGFKSAKAALSGAEAVFGLAERGLSETQIRIPFNGSIVQKTVGLGQLIGAGVPVAEVVQLDSLRVNIKVNETQINSFRKGMPVRLKSSGSNPNAYDMGKVYAVGNAAEMMSKMFPVEILIINKENSLKPGMSTHASIELWKRKDCIVIPKDAMIWEESVPVCYLVKDNVAVKSVLDIELTQGNEVLIKSGVNAEDVLVIVGQNVLRNNQRVSVTLQKTDEIN